MGWQGALREPGALGYRPDAERAAPVDGQESRHGTTEEGSSMDPTFPLQHKRLLRVEEAARILNVSRWTVYRWVETGRLGGTRLSAVSLRIFSHTVAALIAHHCVGSTPVSRSRT